MFEGEGMALVCIKREPLSDRTELPTEPLHSSPLGIIAIFTVANSSDNTGTCVIDIYIWALGAYL